MRGDGPRVLAVEPPADLETMHLTATEGVRHLQRLLVRIRHRHHREVDQNGADRHIGGHSTASAVLKQMRLNDSVSADPLHLA